MYRFRSYALWATSEERRETGRDSVSERQESSNWWGRYPLDTAKPAIPSAEPVMMSEGERKSGLDTQSSKCECDGHAAVEQNARQLPA